GYKQRTHFLGQEEGEINLAESYGWLFVDFIPLLYEKRRIARQLQVETWLDLTQLLNELKLELTDGGASKQNIGANVDYVV
ncbi:MAG: hypothetical protein QXY74_04230, partial [Candidatus Bathyarchaeia archaeon]